MPDTLNGTVLSSEEFRDSLRLRYGLQPTALPTRCDGCSKNFSVEHAMSCKAGGLVHFRHNDVAGEWYRFSGARHAVQGWSTDDVRCPDHRHRCADVPQPRPRQGPGGIFATANGTVISG